jgi:hypothetical protein
MIMIFGTFENAEPSISRTCRGIAIDSREQQENAFESTRVNVASFPNETDKKHMEHEKRCGQRSCHNDDEHQDVKRPELTRYVWFQT